MPVRKKRRSRIRKLIGLIALSMIFSSCYDPSTTSTEAEINSSDEQRVEKFSDLTAGSEGDTALSKDVRHVRLKVQNELPFNREIYQMLDALGAQLTDNHGELDLVLDMRITPDRVIRIHENGTDGITEDEKELWEQLKLAISDLLLSSTNNDAVVKIQYISS